MRRIHRGFLIFATGMLLAACWAMPGQGPDRRAHNDAEETLTADSVSGLSVLWTTNLSNGAASDVVFDSGRVFVHNLTGLHALDGASGEVSWTASPGTGKYFAGAVIVSGDHVLAAAGHQTAPGGWLINRYDKGTGSVTGTIDGDILDGLRGPVVASQQPVRFGTATLWFLKVTNVESGSNWSGLVNILDAFPTPVTIGTEFIYHIGDGPLSSNPAADNFGYGLRAYSTSPPTTGCGPAAAKSYACPAWATPLSGPAAGPVVLSADQAFAYVATTNGFLDAYSTESGMLLWRGELGGIGAAAPALANGQLYAPTREGQLVIFAAGGCPVSPCTATWRAVAGEGMNQQPAVAGVGEASVVFTASTTGELNAFLASPCPDCGTTPRSPLWTAQLGSQVDSAPAVAQGHLYVATLDGRVVAYGLPPTQPAP